MLVKIDNKVYTLIVKATKAYKAAKDAAKAFGINPAQLSRCLSGRTASIQKYTLDHFLEVVKTLHSDIYEAVMNEHTELIETPPYDPYITSMIKASMVQVSISNPNGGKESSSK